MRTNSGEKELDEELLTVMILLAFELLVEFFAINVTVNVFEVAKTWVGFWAVLVTPSPKFQAQEVGFPVEVSVNETVCPLTGVAGVNVKPAVMVPA
jgi:hypothetical protein